MTTYMRSRVIYGNIQDRKIAEYWIVDIQKRMIEIHDLDHEDGEPKY